MVDIQWLIGGEAGYGIMTTGLMMAKIFTRLGLSVFDYVEYPSLIRGGHNAYYVRASDKKIYSQKKAVDILVALNRETIDKHKNELSEKACIIYDPNVIKVESNEFSSSVQVFPVPFLELTKQVNADKLMINTVSIGASLAIFYKDYEVLDLILKDAFSKKGEEVVLENVNTSKAGFDYVLNNFQNSPFFKLEKKQQEDILISGAEAVTIGAIKAGLKFAAIYPMTPINPVLLNLTSYALKYNIIVKEPEDEISGINMAIGASYTGVRSMVATSGGGFALMTEALGLSSQTEIPLVVIEGMRPGPSTGMPTWTEQGDIRFVLHASQGDFPRIILVPGDIFEAFTFTMQAFNLAEKYQMPVIVLVDKYLMESHATVLSSKFKVQSSKFVIERGKILKGEGLNSETNYKRYELTPDGVSLRSLPGQKGGIALSGSDEHDERGLYNDESNNRVKMMDKRFKKLELAKSEIKMLDYSGEDGNHLTIITLGSTYLPIMDAISYLKDQNINTNLLKILSLSPFPKEEVLKILSQSAKTLIIEGNKTGQLEGLVKEQTGISIDYNLRKYDGRPFYPEEIIEKVKQVL